MKVGPESRPFFWGRARVGGVTDYERQFDFVLGGFEQAAPREGPEDAGHLWEGVRFSSVLFEGGADDETDTEVVLGGCRSEELVAEKGEVQFRAELRLGHCEYV